MCMNGCVLLLGITSVVPSLRGKTSCSLYYETLRIIRGNASVRKCVIAWQKHSCLPKETNRLNLIGRKQQVVIFIVKGNQECQTSY